MKRKYKGNIPLLKREIKTPNGRAILMVANVEWSSNDKRAAAKAGEIVRGLLDGLVPPPTT